MRSATWRGDSELERTEAGSRACTHLTRAREGQSGWAIEHTVNGAFRCKNWVAWSGAARAPARSAPPRGRV
jgi:hypothetical protein